jgi:hypothetical protein
MDRSAIFLTSVSTNNLPADRLMIDSQDRIAANA